MNILLQSFDTAFPVGLFVALLVLFIRLWALQSIRDIGWLDGIVVLASFLLGYVAAAAAQAVKFAIDFSKSENLVLATMALFFSVLTYITVTTANDVRKLGDQAEESLKATELEFLRLRAHMRLLSLLRDAELRADMDRNDELRVQHLRLLADLFESEEQCSDTLGVLLLRDKAATRTYIFGELREYIAMLPKLYPKNTTIRTRVAALKNL